MNYHPGLPSDAALAVEPELQTQDLEYLELYNATDAPIDLTNWRLRGGVDFDFPAGQLLAAGSTLLILPFDPQQSEHSSRAEAFRVQYDLDATVAWVGGYEGKLSNSMDWIRVLRGLPIAEGSIVHILEDEVIYDDRLPWPLSADGQGTSLQRQGPEAYGNAAAHWQGELPTPGALPQLAGDLDDDGAVTAADIDLFCRQRPTQDGRLDLNRDGQVDLTDHDYLVKVILGTTAGDANLDGIFDSSDFVHVFVAGQYEDEIPGNSGWAQGDWDCDLDFTTGDFVAAFETGRYGVEATPASPPNLAPVAAAISAERGQAFPERFSRSRPLARERAARRQRTPIALHEDFAPSPLFVNPSQRWSDPLQDRASRRTRLDRPNPDLDRFPTLIVLASPDDQE